MQSKTSIFKIMFFLLCVSTIALTSFSNPARPVSKTPIEKAGQFVSPALAKSLQTTNAQIFSIPNIQALLEQAKAKALKVKYAEDALVLVATDENGEELKLRLSFGIEPQEDISSVVSY
jgi:hypothetical protein